MCVCVHVVCVCVCVCVCVYVCVHVPVSTPEASGVILNFYDGLITSCYFSVRIYGPCCQCQFKRWTWH